MENKDYYCECFEKFWEAFKTCNPPGVYLFLRGKDGRFEFYTIPKEQEHEEYWAVLGWFDREDFYCDLHEAPEDYKNEFIKFFKKHNG